MVSFPFSALGIIKLAAQAGTKWVPKEYPESIMRTGDFTVKRGPGGELLSITEKPRLVQKAIGYKGMPIGPIDVVPMKHPALMMATKESRKYYGKYHPAVRKAAARLGEREGNVISSLVKAGKNKTSTLVRKALAALV